MQINISDQDVKLHTRILQRLQLLLIVAMGLTTATLYNAGAFSKTPVADAKPVADKAEPVVSNPTPTDQSASTAAAEDSAVDESDSNVAAETGLSGNLRSTFFRRPEGWKKSSEAVPEPGSRADADDQKVLP